MKAYLRETNVALSHGDLEANGVHYRQLPLDPAAYQPVLDELSQRRGYGTQDTVDMFPDTPNLDAGLKKFDKEHRHAEDEVRFILEGEGVFDVRSKDDQWMRVVVEAGDLIVVPAGTNHRFELTEKRRIHAVRLFKDPAGWVPLYRDA